MLKGSKRPSRGDGRRDKKKKERIERDTAQHSRTDPDLVLHHVTTAAGTSTQHAYLPNADPSVVLKKDQEKPPVPETAHLRPSQNSVLLQDFERMRPSLLKGILDREASPVFGAPCPCGDGVCHITCNNCIQYRPSCTTCFIRQHLNAPFHWAEVWDAERGFLVRKDISQLGHSISLGHYGEKCALATEGGIVFTVVDVTGIHGTRVVFCKHEGDHVGQLLQAGLFPCTFKEPNSAITFECLKMFEMLSMEGKLANYDFASALRRLTDNSLTEEVPDLEENIIRCARLWGVLTLIKRLGQEHGIDFLFKFRPDGNLVLYCPSCPEPGFNMDPNMGPLPPELRHLNQQRDTLDGNFHCNKAKKNTDPNDVSLFGGKAYFPTNETLKDHLAERQGTEEEPKSTCNHLKAVKNQNKKKFKNMEITGIVNAQCSHVFVKASVDLLFGERYANVDLALAHALQQKIASGHTGDAVFKIEMDSVDRILSYDAMCQYSVHIVERFKANPQLKHLAPIIERMRFSIPALHVQGHQDGCMYVYATVYMEATAHFHGETAEQYWPELNQLGPQTRQMNGGHRQDTIIKHHSDWNYKKLMKAISLLMRDLKTGEELFRLHRAVFLGLSASFVERIDAEGWLRESRTPDYTNMKDVKSVYRMKAAKVPTQNAIYRKMVADEAKAASETDISLDQAAVFLHEGIKIQTLQREIYAAVKSNAKHALTATQKTIIDTRAKVSARIAKLRKVQALIVPQVLNELSIRDSNREASNVESETLGLPSDFADLAERARLDLNTLALAEAQLREGQAFDAIKQVKVVAESISAMQIDKKKNAGGITRNTISLEGINHTKTLLKKWIGEYNSARGAMMVLGHSNGDDFPELKEEDTYRKPTGLRRLGDSRRVDGKLWTMTGVQSGSRTPAAPTAATISSTQPEVRFQGTALTRRKTGPRKVRSVEATARPSEERASGWIWEGKLGKLTAGELEEWSREGNRVQWFRAEAEMTRQLEVVEAKLAEIRTTIRSFDGYRDAWTKMAEEQDAKRTGHIAYAKQKAWMFGERARRGREALSSLAHYATLAKDDADLVAFVLAKRKEYDEELQDVLKAAREQKQIEDEWMDVDDDEDTAEPDT